MGQAGHLKIIFGISTVTVLIVTCYYAFLVDTDSVYSSEILWGENLNNFFDGNISFSYLWRPESLEDSEGSTRYSSDRIGAQLEWTKKLFQNRNIENIRGKNILLVFGKEGGKFWSTNNKIICPGFSIKPEQCKLELSKNLKERSIDLNNFDAVIYTQDYKIPSRKNLKVPDHVLQIVYTEEAPYRLKYTLDKKTLLASYYRGSDIVASYGKWVPYDHEDAEYFGIVNPNYNSKSELLPQKDYAADKTHFAVMFSSNCGNVPNDRFKYVNELKKYISLDIFGACGTKAPCQKPGARAECLDKIVKQYKFYLAFENSNCRDYITEKFFNNSLQNDALPVVLGAHSDDLEYAAPPNSYINTQDFESPKHLADFLITLDKNDTLYNEYFRWKGTGEFYNAWKDLFCRLCGMLFYADFVPPPIWKKTTTWAKVDTCLPWGKWYWDRNE